jgi:hypothetical protein
VIVRCTGKVLALLGVRPTANVSPTDGDWYLNLLWHDRRKCLLATHAATLFPVFVADTRTAELRPLGPWLAAAIHRELHAEHLPDHALGHLDPTQVTIAKTASRRLLGIMNDTALYAEHAITAAGGVDRCDIAELNRRLRRVLHRHAGGYATALEIATAHHAASTS